jgi:O-antigen ligase
MSERIYKNILLFGIAILMIFTPIARGAVRIWSMTPVFSIIYFLLFLWFWKLSGNGIPALTVKKSLLDRLILAFLILAAVSVIFSVYKHDSFYAFLRLLGYAGVYYLIVYNFDLSMKKQLLGLALVIGTGLSIYGLLQYIGILEHSWWFPEEFLAASYVNHNHFAGYLELIIPVALGMLAENRTGSLYYRLVLALTLCLMLVAFIFTQSRGGWISLAISLVVMNIIFIRRGVLKKESIFGLVFILALVIVFFYTQKTHTAPAGGIAMERITQINSDIPVQTRLETWRASLKMIADRPLIGTGIGDFDNGFYRYRPVGFNVKAVYAHNEYLHMAAEMGILAPFLMVFILIAAILNGLKNNFNLVMVGCCCAILGLALHGLVDFNFHIPANMLLFSIYCALVREGEGKSNA